MLPSTSEPATTCTPNADCDRPGGDGNSQAVASAGTSDPAGVQPSQSEGPETNCFAASVLLALGSADCLLTVADVARMLRLSKATVYKLVAEGKLPHVRIGHAIRFVPKRNKP